MKFEKIGIHDLELLDFLVEDIIHELRFKGYFYDEEGRYICEEWSEEWGEKAVEWVKKEDNYLDFRNNKELQEITFQEAMELSFEEIKEHYLKDILKKARGMLRKGTLASTPVYVGDEIDDEYLDNYIALRYKENLKLWSIQRKKKD